MERKFKVNLIKFSNPWGGLITLQFFRKWWYTIIGIPIVHCGQLRAFLSVLIISMETAIVLHVTHSLRRSFLMCVVCLNCNFFILSFIMILHVLDMFSKPSKCICNWETSKLIATGVSFVCGRPFYCSQDLARCQYWKMLSVKPKRDQSRFSLNVGVRTASLWVFMAWFCSLGLGPLFFHICGIDCKEESHFHMISFPFSSIYYESFRKN